ncbi:signal peptidase II [Micavibrio aeruginosavorus]|uniref:Lipoprotein signal peptidase n=1 Tax=Micavibrio aeruginosavorus EPB TaxID=349215 RepID=M4VL22_9BACT|nr:signal peptidase II [Micavibrio aeruginosavorus]AGH98811.1 Lipoprotein signal peptidase [Micavibrio aeruginosavorus EPB]
MLLGPPYARVAFPLAGLLLVLDQISKWWITEIMIKPLVTPANEAATAMPFLNWLFSAGDRFPFAQIEVLPFFNLVMVWNRGVSFGLFSQGHDYGPAILTIVSLLIMTAFAVWLVRAKSAWLATGLTLVIGGAAGNVIDRVRFGAVIDFLDVHVAGFHWPAFNVADSCISIGIALILIDGLFLEPKRNKGVSQ